MCRRPDLGSGPALSHTSFWGTSLSLSFIICKMQLMIPTLQDYFADFCSVPCRQGGLKFVSAKLDALREHPTTRKISL